MGLERTSSGCLLQLEGRAKYAKEINVKHIGGGDMESIVETSISTEYGYKI